MNKTFIKIVITIFLAFFANNSVFAINSEFKNTLLNIDLAKTSENGYNINLYTSKKYNSPVKIIKKSDLSYYILLPETKNISPGITMSSPDIRSITTVLYPYAGVDVNNGYTKISINTTRPLNFNVITKNATQKTVNSNKTLTSANDEDKLQKKNLQLQQKDTIKQTSNPIQEIKKENVAPKSSLNEVKKQPVSAVETKKEKITTNLKNEAETKKLQNKTAKKEIKIDSLTKKTVSNNVEKLSKKAQKETLNIKNKLAKLTSEQKKHKKTTDNFMAAAKITPDEVNEDNLKENQLEEKILEDSNQNKTDKDLEKEKIIEETEILKDEASENSDIKQETPSKRNLFEKIKNKSEIIFLAVKSSLKSSLTFVLNMFKEYAITIFTIVAGIISFIITLILLLVVIPKFMPKEEPSAKLKSRAELLKKESSLIPKNKEEKKKDDKYFVFEDNIKQISLSDPTEVDGKKNFELVSYDPDIRIDSDNENEKDDLAIIQKILNNDDFIDIEEAQIEPYKEEPQKATQNDLEPKTDTLIKQEEKVEVQEETEKEIETEEPIRKDETTTSPIGLEHIEKEPLKDTTNSPKLINSFDIDSEKGFMFISYNNNINLMGYINDNVFNLHNFKARQLNNYNLQYRLADKDEKGNIYIVKTDTVKLLVKVTANSMNTEIIL